MSHRAHLWLAAWLLVVYSLGMALTNPRLTVLDDEATIVTAANTPVARTLGAFLHGNGQHEHPPLSDIALHGWLRLTRAAPFTLRLFANFFYVAGLLLIAQCALQLAGRRAAWAALLFGTLWPFGYFYARIAGWYAFCFFLVALLLLAYMRLLRQTTAASWMLFTAAGVCLLCSSYFAPAILVVLLLHALLYRRAWVLAHGKALLAAVLVMAAGFAPWLHALLADAGTMHHPPSMGLLQQTLALGYCLFILFASVSVAPWFYWWSVPVGIALAALAGLVLADRRARGPAAAFLLLLIALAASNHLDLKRLLFLTPFLILALALALAGPSCLRRRALLACLVIACGTGWLGIAGAQHSATANFHEPWQTVAERTLVQDGPGSAVISNSVSYFYYANRALGLEAAAAPRTYLGAQVYEARGRHIYFDSLPPGAAPTSFRTITVVRGISLSPDLDALDATMAKLRAACVAGPLVQSTPDPAAAYKHLIAPRQNIIPYRIAVETFLCGHAVKH